MEWTKKVTLGRLCQYEIECVWNMWKNEALCNCQIMTAGMANGRCANIGLFSVPLTICMEFPKHFKFLGSPPPAVPTVRGDGRAVVHSGEKKSESTFSSLYPSPPPDPPAESVLLFACTHLNSRYGCRSHLHTRIRPLLFSGCQFVCILYVAETGFVETACQ